MKRCTLSEIQHISTGKCHTTEDTGMVDAVFILSFYFQQLETNIWNCVSTVRK